MSASVHIDEQNGPVATPTLTHNIANSNMGSADGANLDPTTCPVAPGGNTCEKWQLLHVTDLGTSSKVNNIKVWRSGALGAEAIHMTNATQTGYSGTASYTPPTTVLSTLAKNLMPTSTPTTANLGIAGSLTGSLVGSGYSDFLVHQIQTTPKAMTGSTSTINYQYDEIA